MQNKAARKAARSVNRFLQPELIDPDGERKLGRGIPKTQRDFSAIVRAVDRSFRSQDKTLPREISPTHYLVTNKLISVALRDNLVEEEIKCPHCKERLPVVVNNAKSEANSVKALETLADRMFPKLASLTHEINVAGQINVITDQLAAVIVKYVPADKKMLCLGEITDLIENVQRNEQQKQIDNVNGLAVSA